MGLACLWTHSAFQTEWLVACLRVHIHKVSFHGCLQIVQAGEVHGIRFPREFGLLVKQMLYFDRYTRILAPEMSVLSNERINAARDQQDR